MMLYQCFKGSDKERLGREVIEAHEKAGQEGWTQKTERIARRFGIKMVEAETKNKGWWKTEIKGKIEMEIERQDKENDGKKTRHQRGQGFRRKGYIGRMSVSEVAGTIKRRLEMMDVGNNLGKRRKCRCGEEKSTEHIIK